MHIVVDTNVAIVANKKSEQASATCVDACLRYLEALQVSDTLVIDAQWYIIKEYMQNLRSEGQPGAGDAFLRWVLINRTNPQRVEQVAITPLDNSGREFLEFPTDEALKGFDPADRKFVAVALVHSEHPPILNAVDPHWGLFKEALQAHGVESLSLCPDDLERLMSGKQSR